MSGRLRSWGREVAVVVAISALTSIAAHAGWLDGFETAGLDALLRITPPLEARHVVVVEITDEDYATLFGSTSPLDPARLRELLAAIARGRPRTIAVDLDTDPQRVAAAAPSVEEPPRWPLTVWAMEMLGSPSGRVAERRPGMMTGAAVFPVDRDGVVRRHDRLVHLDAGGPAIESLPWMVVRAFCDGNADHEVCSRLSEIHAEGELVLNFAGDRFDFRRMTATSLLAAAKGAAWGTDQGPLHGRIALLGGLYRAARDQHVTPLGETAGVYIIAQAIESDLEGRGIRPVNEVLMVLLEIGGGLLIVVLHHVFGVRTAFRLSLIGIPVLAASSSFVAFYSFSRWASFAPVLLAVLLHELYEGAKRGEPPISHHV